VWVFVKDLRVLQGPWRKPILWTIAGWPLVWETLIGGQASLFALLILCITVALLRRQRFALAGCVLALAVCKPNVLAFVAFGCLLRYPKLLRGAVPMLAILGLCSLVPSGWSGLGEYLALGTRLAVQPWALETPYWKVHGLASCMAALPGEYERACSLLLGMVATGAVVWYWRRASTDQPAVFCLAIALLVSINALLNPYTPIYDLVLLLAGGLLTAEVLVLRYGDDVSGRLGVSQLLLAALYFGPHLSQLTARATTFQPFALVLLAISVWQAREFGKAVLSSGSSALRSRVACSTGG
jgi:hypothetical protein